MKLINRYKILKREYPNHIVLLKNGMFFTTYYDDAYILNYLLGYQICDGRVGFPINSLDKILGKIEDYDINIYIENEEITKFEYEKNVYKEMLKIAKKNYFQELNTKVLLEEIEFLLKSNPKNISKLKNFINEL